MPLTVAQLHEIRRIIERHHNAFIVNAVGVEAVAPEVLEELKDAGLVNVKVDSVKDAYLYGQAVAAATNPKVAKMTYDQFKEWVQKNPVPLSDIEQKAMAFAQQQAAQYVVGLGNRVNQQTGQLMIEADAALRAKMRGVIRDATRENIAARESVKKLKSNLGWATKDWARDWDRIAITEKHTSMQRGVADHYGERYGKDVRVAKRPTPDACEHCKRLHIGPDGHPRIFKLSTLEANGLNNFGRKAADWLPVVGSTHPHCQCQLVRVPAGWGFDEEGSLAPGGEFGVSYEDETELAKALIQEMDLQKAYALEGHTLFQGLDIRIENKVGSKRRWTDENGESGSVTMLYAYGYIQGTKGADEDEIDVFLGPDPKARFAYIIHQQQPGNGRYDEDKVMLGFSSKAHARVAYQWHYNRPDFYVAMTPMEMEHFKRWIKYTDEHAQLKKNGKAVQPHVISLEKAKVKGGLGTQGGLSVEFGADSRAIFRNPGPGTVVNYMANIEPRPAPTVTEEMKDVYRDVIDDQQYQNDKVKRDKETFIFDAPGDRRNYRYELDLPDVWGKVDSEDVEANREDLEKLNPLGNRSAGHKNKAEPESLDKAVTPIGGITPGGYLKVGKDEYVDPKKKKKPPPKKKPPHVVTGPMPRQGDVTLVSKSEVQAPKVYEGFVQRDHDIAFQREPGGPTKLGTLAGYNYQGRPVVRIGDKQRTYEWGQVKATKPQPYKSVADHLTRKDALIKPNDRQRKLVDEVLQLNIAEGKSALAYMDWLRSKGNEVYLVGGIVRDLVAGTSPESNLPDVDVKQQMKDIDIVSTAHPQIAKQMAAKIGGTNVHDNSEWGVAQILDGVGLDVSSIASKGGVYFGKGNEGLGVWDHDLEDDCQRRDFTANCLFYDVHNKVIVDPLGTGYADAQAKVLRLAPSEEEAKKNDTLPMRFWKFRARGWKTEEKTLEYMKKALPKMSPKRIRKELKKMTEKGPKALGGPTLIWNQLRNAMIEDGAYDLYQKYIKPHKKKVLGGAG